ncbi:MAG: hypothetical protein SGBAC_000003 [Bacillariaceae sp.]
MTPYHTARSPNVTNGEINSPACTCGNAINSMTCPPPSKRAPLFSPEPHWPSKSNNHKAPFAFGTSNVTAPVTARFGNPFDMDWRTSLAGNTPFSVDNYLENNPSPYPKSEINIVGLKEAPPPAESHPTRQVPVPIRSRRKVTAKRVAVLDTGKSRFNGTMRETHKAKFHSNLCPDFALISSANNINASASIKAAPLVTNAANAPTSIPKSPFGMTKAATTTAFTFSSTKTRATLLDDDIGAREILFGAPTRTAFPSTAANTRTYPAIFEDDDGLETKVVKNQPNREQQEIVDNKTADLESRVNMLEERMLAFMGSSDGEEENCPPQATPTKSSIETKTPCKTPCNNPNPTSPRVTRSMSAKKTQSSRHSMALRQLTPARD